MISIERDYCCFLLVIRISYQSSESGWLKSGFVIRVKIAWLLLLSAIPKKDKRSTDAWQYNTHSYANRVR